MSRDYSDVRPNLRYIYRGLEIRDDPSQGLRAANHRATLSVGAPTRCFAAIFYGGKWGGVKDARVVKIDLEKGARRYGLSGKALELATDSREILLEAAPQSGPLVIPFEAMSVHVVRIDALSEQQREPIRWWKRLLQSGQRMETFCASTPPLLEAYIVSKIYQPRMHYLVSSSKVYHFNGACPAKADDRVSLLQRQCPSEAEGWRACQQCMMICTDCHQDERQQLFDGTVERQLLDVQLLDVIGAIVNSSRAQRLASHSLETWIRHVGGTF
eukprot:4224826-Prymnesium_polylepis.1